VGGPIVFLGTFVSRRVDPLSPVRPSLDDTDLSPSWLGDSSTATLWDYSLCS